MGHAGANSPANPGKNHLLEIYLSQVASPCRHRLNGNTRGDITGTRIAGNLWVYQGYLQIGDQPIQVVNKLAGVLAAPSIGSVPEIGIKSQVHNQSVVEGDKESKRNKFG